MAEPARSCPAPSGRLGRADAEAEPDAEVPEKADGANECMARHKPHERHWTVLGLLLSTAVTTVYARLLCDASERGSGLRADACFADDAGTRSCPPRVLGCGAVLSRPPG
jgi:hypothetical protein